MFIINKKEEYRSLEDFLSQKISYCEEVKILTGFFYFSSIDILIDFFKKNEHVKIKILVGLQVDVYNFKLIEYANENSFQYTKSQIKQMFVENFKKPFQLKEFDSKEFEEKAKFFINLIQDKRLEIRKTLVDNHAKLFILKMNEDSKNLIKGFWITGSSNLTRPGLREQEELNVAIVDWGHEDANKYFDNLWKESVELKDTDIKQLVENLKDNSPLREITPFEAYLLFLYEYMSLFSKKEIKPLTEEIMIKAGYKPYEYQKDAIGQALSIIEKFNGVIIADVVGLGKSVIASAIAKDMGKRGIVIAPPGLIGDDNGNYGWKKYLADFQLTSIGWDARSSGKLEEIKEFVNKNKDIEVIIVDEAHRFRNEETQNYALLHEICRNKKVILLTATPFNNRPADIYALLKLFIIPKKSPITIDSNLEEYFRKLESAFKKLKDEKKNNPKNTATTQTDVKLKNISQEIKSILTPVMIRRNRLDLTKHPEYKKDVKNLSSVKDPECLYFELTPKQSEFYDKVISTFVSPDDKSPFEIIEEIVNKTTKKFIGAIYQPFMYKKEEDTKQNNNHIISEKIKSPDFEEIYQKSLYDLMRRLLVKRFESSFDAFEKSIQNFINIHKKVLHFIELNEFYILDRDWINKISELEDDPEEYAEELNKKLIEVLENQQKKGKRNTIIYNKENLNWKNFINAIKKDIQVFEEIHKEFQKLNLLETNPKGHAVCKKINEILSKNEHPKRKILIFSEFKDTITGLYSFFEKNYPEIYKRTLLINKDINKSLYETILSNFDASYPKEKQVDDYDVLLCTDKLSEGFNLNRAGAIINYDIPWNPVRVIQRLGRINRISKKVFDELYIFNFFPTIQGELHINQRKIAETKMFLIHNAIGEDSKIFSPDEEPSPSKLFEKINQNPEKLEEENILTKVYIELENLRKNYPQEIISFENKYKNKLLPPRIKTFKPSNSDELVTMIKQKNLYFIYFNYNTDKPQSVSFEQIWEKIKCTPDTPALPKSPQFWAKYQKTLDFNFNSNDSDPDSSNRRKAIHILKSIIHNPEFKDYYDEIDHILKDLEEYGSLPTYFIRKIAGLNTQSTKDFKTIINELGDKYFQNQTFDLIHSQIIVTIENQSKYQQSKLMNH
ncbi:MAG: helicase-related protein [Bacteroidia bacterium]|nr:helicase-related protein [Bacteroidia bacterium]